MNEKIYENELVFLWYVLKLTTHTRFERLKSVGIIQLTRSNIVWLSRCFSDSFEKTSWNIVVWNGCNSWLAELLMVDPFEKTTNSIVIIYWKLKKQKTKNRKCRKIFDRTLMKAKVFLYLFFDIIKRYIANRFRAHTYTYFSDYSLCTMGLDALVYVCFFF